MAPQETGSAALKALRRKFIFTNMLFVVIVLAVMCAVMAITTAHQRTSEVYDALDRRLSMSLEQRMGGHPTFDDWMSGRDGSMFGGEPARHRAFPRSRGA